MTHLDLLLQNINLVLLLQELLLLPGDLQTHTHINAFSDFTKLCVWLFIKLCSFDLLTSHALLAVVFFAH